MSERERERERERRRRRRKRRRRRSSKLISTEAILMPCGHIFPSEKQNTNQNNNMEANDGKMNLTFYFRVYII